MTFMAVTHDKLMAALVFAMSSVLVSSCVQALGIEDLPGACGASYAGTECSSCMSARCCDEVAPCTADATCGAELACTNLCFPDDAACRIRCGPPSDRVAAVQACERASCTRECLGCGSYGDPFGAACSDCLAQTACEVERSCTSHPGSDAYLSCVIACEDPGCADACYRDLDVPDFERAFAVIGAAIGCLPCDFGRHWSCVDQHAVAPPIESAATIRVAITSYLGKPLDGLTVTACNDLACSPVIATTKSAGGGIAEVTVPLNPLSSGFAGFLDVEDAKDGIMPSLLAIDGLRGSLTFPSTIFRVVEVQFGLASLHEHFDPTRDAGAVFLAFDCDGVLAPDVHFELDPPYDAVSPFYIDNASLSTTATSTLAGGDAIAIFHTADGKLPSSNVAFKARLVTTNEVVGSGLMPLRIGAMTYGDHVFHVKPAP